MDYPFYRNYYYPATEVAVPSRRETRPATARKVINVPVMDGSEKPRRSRSDSAVTIQKVLRGFLVRKNVKKIAGIKAEVDEMENRITSRECMDLIGKDSKERLKVNEMLMRLLLKLDSVRGIDSGVRDLRKAVIKKAIRMQELVDSISDQNESDLNSNSNPVPNFNAVEMQNNREFESAESVPEAINAENQGNAAPNAPEVEDDGAKSNPNSNTPENNVDANLESQSAPEDRENEQIQGNLAKSANESNSDPNSDADRDLEMQNNIQSVPEAHGNGDAEEANECAESMELSQDDESQTGSSANPENVMEGDEDRGSDSDTSEKRANGEGEAKEGEKRKNVELLEKLVEENEKMMGLMADLFKKNEMQTQLLSSLSQRVEHLERALMCERFRRKKKRNGTC